IGSAIGRLYGRTGRCEPVVALPRRTQTPEDLAARTRPAAMAEARAAAGRLCRAATGAPGGRSLGEHGEDPWLLRGGRLRGPPPQAGGPAVDLAGRAGGAEPMLTFLLE